MASSGLRARQLVACGLVDTGSARPWADVGYEAKELSAILCLKTL